MRFRLLGPLEVVEGSQSVVITREKVRALLALLLVHTGQVLTTDRIVDELWRGASPARPAGTVQNYVSILRRLLEPGIGPGEHRLLVTRPAGYELRAAGEDVDATVFTELAAAVRASSAQGRPADTVEGAERALALWRGPVLADLRFYDFVEPFASRMDELRRVVVEQRLQAMVDLGRHVEAVPELEVAVVDDPLREGLWGQLMTALYRSGRQADALAAYQAVRRALGEELGLEPSPALRDLEASILRQDSSLAPTAAPRARPHPIAVAAQPFPDNLPQVGTGFVGRQQHLEVLQQILDSGDVRLLTLTGPGGTGKTRLAVQAAASHSGSVDGVCFVPLAAVRQADLVTQSVVQALGAPQPPEQPAPVALRRFVADLRVLLVLDNLEQIPSAGRAVDEVLGCGEGITVLATSRTPLHSAAEHEYPVPPMELPTSTGAAAVDEKGDAVALFTQRAGAVQPGFALSADNAAAVADICLRVDGLPLAIELAAARIRVLSPQELADRLDPRLDVLTRGGPDLPERHRTLRETIAWSYDLLEPDEQQIFRQLAPFTGGCSLASAESVIEAPGVVLLDGITALVESSLLLREEPVPGISRFRMLETIREFALEQLEAHGESDRAHRRHTEHHLAVARRADEALYANDEHIGLAELDREHTNIVAALEWALSCDGELALGLVGAMGLYWYTRGHIDAGIDWIESALAAGAQAPRALHADPSFWLGAMLNRRGDHAAARTWAERCVDLMRETEDGDTYRVAAALNHVGTVAEHQGDLPSAEAAFQESFEVYRAIGSAYGMGVTLVGLGDLALQEGDLPRAADLFEQAMQWYEQIEGTWDRAIACCHVARLTLEQGDLDRTTTLVTQAIEVLRGRGELAYLAECLHVLAGVAAHRGTPSTAGRLMGAADGLRESIGARQPLPVRAMLDRHIERARSCDAQAFEAARRAGALVPIDGVLDELAQEGPHGGDT